MGLKEGTRVPRLVKVTGLIGLVGVAATGCTTNEVLRFGWPQGVTPQAESMRQLWTWSVIAALAVGVLVWGLIFWSVAFHRKKSEELPRQFQYNLPLEIIYSAIPFVMVVVLFYFTAVTQNYVLAKPANPDVKVNVVSFQWNWEFNYPGYKTPDGQPVRTVGSSEEIPLLVLPTDSSVEYHLSSTDVIHSFFVPEFHFKRDTFPHPDKNNQDNVFQNTIDREGSFVGRCAELCGTYHSMMNFEVRALSKDKFDQYMQLRTRINPQTGSPYTASEALGEMKCGELCAPRAVTGVPFDTERTGGKPSGIGTAN
ncbi:cytochrome c oxidase subunit 2 [Saccharopolyspora erythraea NRRL 2338]|uniref:Cytochrome c oxidase subunit 2 n=1 Tax=Saccharopolyspora erythraea TaxID=1836 RepID=A0ABP3MS59_SACER|nr:cytochrome c oxidase subunit II [Saccharopolyspora erythraea]PFG94783.1 cytochrome c oxidase subunit 2 [Saccharopolyspora erythraea NRRL 2338]QRK91501.1 cytochrome c oxidase subunit II [Saccharopolyspora erythraea]